MSISKRFMLQSLIVLGCLSCGRGNSFPLSHITLKARYEQHQASSYFELSNQQAIQVISDLKSFIHNNQTSIAPEFESYYFQLTAYKSSGQNLVHINAFHQNAIQDSPDWREKPVSVKGGGISFWKVQYSLDTRSVISFWANADK